jgi:hypothetical protein
VTRKPRGASDKIAELMLPDNTDLIIGGGQPGRVSAEAIAVPPPSMCVFKDRLFVAMANAVFERDDDGVFRECKFELAV